MRGQAFPLVDRGRSWAAALGLLGVLGCAHAEPVPCEALGAMPGPEDFDVLPPRGEAALLVSSVERRGDERETATGSLLLLDAATGAVEPMPLLGRDACSFRPHGLSTVQRLSRAWEAFVVVHHHTEDRTRPGCTIEPHGDAEPLDSIERYRLEDGGLRFLERLHDPRMTNLNDVDAAPDGRLWVSNNPEWAKPSQLVADMLLGRRRGQVLLYRPIERTWSVAMPRMLYANGVAVDDGGDVLWVAGARGHVWRFALDGVGEADGRPDRRGRARGTLDNLSWADDGVPWTTGHPDALAFLRHVRDPAAIAPTEVFRITPHERLRRRLAVQRVLRVDDGRVDAGSVALPIGDGIAIGQVFDAGVMLCHP